MIKKLLMEFLGTFFLAFTIAMTANPVAIAAILMTFVYIGGHVSGAHFNPAVTTSLVMKRGMSWLHGLYYAAAQTAGGFVAFAAYNSISQKLFLPAPAEGILFAHALSIEILLTFVLCMIILTMVASPVLRGNQIYGFAIGFAILALAYTGGAVSGGLFNPALIFSAMLFALLKGMTVVTNHLIIYGVGPLVGAVGATLAYNYFNNER